MALVYKQAWGGNDDAYGNIMGQNPAGTYDSETGQYFGPADLTGDFSKGQGSFISNASYNVGTGREGAMEALMLAAKHGPQAVAQVINSNPAYASLGITANDIPGIVQSEASRDAKQKGLDAGWAKSTDSGIFGMADNFMNSPSMPLALFGGMMGGVGGFSDLMGSFSGADSPFSSFSQSWTQPTQVSSSGGGMDWFDQLIGNDFNIGTTYGTDAIPSWMQGNTNWFGADQFAGVPNADTPLGTTYGSDAIPSWMQGNTNWLGSNGTSLLKNLLGGSAPNVNTLGGLGSLFGGTGGLLGAGLGGLAGLMSGTKKVDDAVTTESGFNPTLSPAAEAEMLKTIRGDYLNPDSNPWLKSTFDRSAGEIQSKLSPSFGHMEAFGQNSGWQNAYGRSLADLSTSLYGGNYNNERTRQYSAASSAPNYVKRSTTPVYNNPMGGMFSGALAGGLLGGKMFGG